MAPPARTIPSLFLVSVAFFSQRCSRGDEPRGSCMRPIGRMRSRAVKPQSTEAAMTLRDDLLNYMAANARPSITPGAADVVIVGELHGRLRSNAAAIRTTATIR